MKQHIYPRYSLLIVFLCLLNAPNTQAQCILFNEVMANGLGGTDDNLGNAQNSEWIELYNLCDTPQDISCYRLCDGDWCVTFPDATLIPAFGYFVVGSDSSNYLKNGNITYLQDEGMLDLNWASCNCTFQVADAPLANNEIGALNNDAEQLSLLDADGVLIGGIVWGGGETPSGTGTFPQNITFPSIDVCSILTIDLPDPTSIVFYENIGTNAGCDGCVLQRSCDGNIESVWTNTSTEATPGTLNPHALIVDFIIPDTICVGEPFNLIDATTYTDANDTGTGAAAWTYEWIIQATNFTDTIREQNPVDVILNLDFDYTVGLTVTNESACAYTKIAPSFTSLQASAFFSVSNQNICKGDSIQFNTFSEATEYDWLIEHTTMPINFTSNEAEPTFLFDVLGIYDVSLVVNCGISKQELAYLTVIEPPTISAIADKTTICSGEMAELSATGAGSEPEATYSWTTEAGTIVGTGQNQTVSPTTTTTYVVVGTDSSACQDTAMIEIMVNPSPNIQAVESNLTACGGDTITLAIIEEGFVYQWTGEGLLDSVGASVRAVPTANTTYTVSTTEPCTGMGDIIVMYNASPAPTINSSFPICEGDTWTVTANGTNILWYDENKNIIDSNPNFNPPASFIDNLPLNTPVSIYVSQNISNCRSELAEVILQIFTPDNIPDVSFNLPDTICGIQSIDLDTLVTGTLGGTWTTSASSSNLNEAIFTTNGLSAGNYDIIYTVEVGNCSRSDSTQTLTLVQGFADFSADATTVCTGVPLQFNNESLGTDSNFDWTFTNTNTGNSFFSNEENPQRTFTEVGSYDVALTIGCGASEVKVNYINVDNAITTEVTASANNLCANANTPITLNASGGDNYNWTTDPSLSATNIASPTVNPSNTTTYYVNISNNNSNCTALDSITIIVEEGPNISINPAIINQGENLNVADYTSIQNAINISWSGGEGTFSNPNIANPIYTPASTELGNITLQVTTDNNCGTQTNIFPLTINTSTNPTDTTTTNPNPSSKAEPIILATAFSPNGDQQNDYLQVLADNTQIDYFTLRIYNRWGKLLFETSQVTEVWDGTFKNENVNMGVYPFYIVYKLKENIIEKTKSGNITLLR